MSCKKIIGITGLAIICLLLLCSIDINHQQIKKLYSVSRAEASGTQTLGELNFGDRVVDKSWQWEYRTGDDYTISEGDKKKPVVWIVVASEHYGEGSGITLLAEELIAVPSVSYVNDDNRYWQYSGLRFWLNSVDIYNQEGFYRAFSSKFRNSLVTVDIPNIETKSPHKTYSTQDNVFVPSATELGDKKHNYSPAIGQGYAYFLEKEKSVRVAFLDNQLSWYWTRSPLTVEPDSVFYLNIVCVDNEGNFSYKHDESQSSPEVSWPPTLANRPAVNMKPETLVTAQPNSDGIYEILWPAGNDTDQDYTLGDVNNDGVIDVKDVVLTMRYALDLAVYTDREKKAADVNGDGVVDVMDVTLIMRRALGILKQF